MRFSKRDLSEKDQESVFFAFILEVEIWKILQRDGMTKTLICWYMLQWCTSRCFYILDSVRSIVPFFIFAQVFPEPNFR